MGENKKQAFTIIELLVVIAMMGLLASLIVINLNNAKESAEQKKAMEFAHTARVSLGDSLVGEWTFDDGTAKDTSGNGNNGTINGATPVDGIIRRALSFDGNDYVEALHSSNFDLKELTIELWIKAPSSMGGIVYRALLSKQSTVVNDRDYNFYTYSTDGIKVTRLHFSSHRFGSSSYNLPSAYNPNTWHYVAFTINLSAKYNYYSDGVNFASGTGIVGNANNDYPIRIGRADNYWNGTIDEVRVYNRALTSAEIQQHYVEGAAKHGIARLNY